MAVQLKRGLVTLPNGLKMSQIGPSKHTRIERQARMWLVRNRIPHRLHPPIPGHPRRSADIEAGGVYVFLHGRFWHDPSAGTKRMSAFWRKKVRANASRDLTTLQALRRVGAQWTTIWDDQDVASRLESRFWRLREILSASSAAARTCRTRSRGPGR